MSTPEEFRDADLKRHRTRGRNKAKLAERQYQSDLAKLMSEAWGRRLVWTWLERANIFHPVFSTHSGEMSFKEGQRNVGLRLMNELVAIAPFEYDLMVQENRKARGATDKPDTDEDE